MSPLPGAGRAAARDEQAATARAERAAPSLATRLLADFLAAVSSLPDVDAALDAAVRRAASSLDADVAAVCWDGIVRASVGFPPDDVPHAEVAAVVEGTDATVPVPGRGRAQAIAVPLTVGSASHLLVGRCGDQPFDSDEAELLGGMARVIDLTVGMLRTLEAERSLRARIERQASENTALVNSLRERQRLLEKLSEIQRAISRREPLPTILDAITAGARALLGDDTVALWQSEGFGASQQLLVSWAGVDERVAEWLAHLPVPTELSPGRPILPDQPVHGFEFADGTPHRGRIRVAIATPVHENGTVIGSLVAASSDATRRYGAAERAVLRAFAEHVSLAITDANTLEAMYRAFHDSLTGLASRALFLDRLQHGLIQAARSKSHLTLLFIDLDRFKMVNDTLGHASGDLLLVEVADRLRACLRASDTAARFGGDEFVVLLHGTNAKDAEIVAQRIIDAVRVPFRIRDLDVFVDASVGIASSDAGSRDADELLRNADVAMYRAKRAGRGRFATYEPTMHAALVERLQMEAELHGALDRGEMVVHYQPIVALATGEVTGVEALLRWNHPRHGQLVPADFVPIAEECGALVPIGSWVLRQACEQVRRWQAKRRGEPPLTVSVNISARQLEQPDLCAEIRDALAATELPPGCLILEITEALILADEPWLLARLDELKQLGVLLAVDDFGAGYSSLATLRELPLDIVKIDQSFVEEIGTSSEGSAIACKIVELGHTLDLQIIAEGVQTVEQFDELRRARCELGQGYFFAEPVLTDDLPVLRGDVESLWRRPRSMPSRS